MRIRPIALRFLTACLVCLAGRCASAALSATATVSTSQTTAPYTYSIALHNTGTTNIGSFWFAWNPSGYNFLATQPLSVIAPTNWSYTLSNIYPGYDGYGLEFVDNGSLLAPGATLSGFSFVSNDSPQELKSNSIWYPNPPVTTSYVYQGAPLGDPGAAVTVSVVPEPAAILLAAAGALAVISLTAARHLRRPSTTGSICG